MALFIGGHSDGKTIEVPSYTPVYYIHVPVDGAAAVGCLCKACEMSRASAGIETYKRLSIYGEPNGPVVHVFVLDGLSRDDVLALLLKHYRPNGWATANALMEENARLKKALRSLSLTLMEVGL